MISASQINEFSKRLAIDQFTIIRTYIQIVFLSVLYAAPESKRIVFKGGTAIQLLLQSGRFSEDLDFTSTVSAAVLAPLVEETIKKTLLVVPDLSLKPTKEYPSSYTGILSYKTERMKHPLNIHLDFSLREIPETSKDTVLESDFPVAPPPVIRHMDWPEILAEKIRALLYRQKGRDVYDLWFLLQCGIALDWAMINRKLKFYSMQSSLQDLTDRIGQFDDTVLKQDLGKFLPAHDRGLVQQLKELTLAQLASRQGFTITQSKNLEYTKIPGGSFSGADLLPVDLAKTKILNIKRQDENTLIISITNEDANERVGFVRARNRNGVRELNIIQSHADTFNGTSYDQLIHHQFST